MSDYNRENHHEDHHEAITDLQARIERAEALAKKWRAEGLERPMSTTTGFMHPAFVAANELEAALSDMKEPG